MRASRLTSRPLRNDFYRKSEGSERDLGAAITSRNDASQLERATLLLQILSMYICFSQSQMDRARGVTSRSRVIEKIFLVEQFYTDGETRARRERNGDGMSRRVDSSHVEYPGTHGERMWYGVSR